MALKSGNSIKPLRIQLKSIQHPGTLVHELKSTQFYLINSIQEVAAPPFFSKTGDFPTKDKLVETFGQEEWLGPFLDVWLVISIGKNAASR